VRIAAEAQGFGGHLVVKQGERGVTVAVDGELVAAPTAPARVLDVTGEGDAFCGGFIAGLVETGDPVLAARYGWSVPLPGGVLRRHGRTRRARQR
jgi:ribokinase